MIIDLILDRKDGAGYTPRDFYMEVMQYGRAFPNLAHPITMAMDAGNEQDVKTALCNYIDECDYNPQIKNYINSQNWL